MKNITINGIEAMNFGASASSCGMEVIVFNARDTHIGKVALLPHVYLHPTQMPTSLEIFALLGTKKQFEAFYEKERLRHCTAKAFRYFKGVPQQRDEKAWEIINEEIDMMIEEFVAWYEDTSLYYAVLSPYGGFRYWGHTLCDAIKKCPENCHIQVMDNEQYEAIIGSQNTIHEIETAE